MAIRLGLGEFIMRVSSEKSEKNVLLVTQKGFTLLQLLQYYGTGFF